MTAIGIPQKSFDYSGKTIIDCPSCGTRFCVKNDIIQKHSNPNFHCSKCDNVFRVPNSALRYSSEETKSDTSTSTTKGAYEIKATSPNLKFFDVPREPRTPLVSAPHETVMGREIQPPRIDNGLNSNPPPLSKAVAGGGITRDIRDPKPRRQIKAIELLKNVNIFGKGNRSEGAASTPAPSFNLYAASHSSGGRWQDLLSIATPVLIFLLTLSLITFYFVKNPGTASSIISAIVPSSPRMAPSGLHITETEFTKITLDSGEEVALISGEIQNKTDYEFGTVQLEAQAFDREGALIKKFLTSSGGALVNTRVKSLSPKMIQSLQEANGPKRLSMAPKKSERFTVALLGENMNRAAYFSIRIYSVRAQS